MRLCVLYDIPVLIVFSYARLWVLHVALTHTLEFHIYSFFLFKYFHLSLRNVQFIIFKFEHTICFALILLLPAYILFVLLT